MHHKNTFKGKFFFFFTIFTRAQYKRHFPCMCIIFSCFERKQLALDIQMTNLSTENILNHMEALEIKNTTPDLKGICAVDVSENMWR